MLGSGEFGLNKNKKKRNYFETIRTIQTTVPSDRCAAPDGGRSWRLWICLERIFQQNDRISVLEKRKLADDRPVCGTITIFPADLRGIPDRIPEKRKSTLFSDPFDRTFKSDYVYSDFSVR